MNWKRYTIYLILFVAIALRFYNLSVGDLGNDEGKTALGVDYPHSFVLPNLSLASQSLFGVNEFAVRFPFAVLGCLGVIIFYFLGKEIKDRNFGLLSALAAAVFPANIIFSRSAFLDVALVTAWAGVLLFWFRYGRTKNLWDAFFLFIFVTISLFFKIQAIYLLAALGVVLIWKNKGYFWHDKRFWLIASGFIIFVLYFASQPQQIYETLDYVTREMGTNLQGISTLPLFLWRGYGLWLLVGLFGCYSYFRNHEKKIELPIFFTIILAVLTVTPSRFYYIPMLDIPMAYFVTLGLYWFWNLSRSAGIFVGLTASLFGIVLTCLVPGSSILGCRVTTCHWQNNSVAINREIKSLNSPAVFISLNIGYEGRWYLDVPVNRIDYLPEFLKNNPKHPLAILKLTDQSDENKYQHIPLKKDFGFLKMYAR